MKKNPVRSTTDIFFKKEEEKEVVDIKDITNLVLLKFKKKLENDELEIKSVDQLAKIGNLFIQLQGMVTENETKDDDKIMDMFSGIDDKNLESIYDQLMDKMNNEHDEKNKD